MRRELQSSVICETVELYGTGEITCSEHLTVAQLKPCAVRSREDTVQLGDRRTYNGSRNGPKWD